VQKCELEYLRTLEEIKAIADLLAMSTGDGIPCFFDETLEHIGCLITDRVKANMDEINRRFNHET